MPGTILPHMTPRRTANNVRRFQEIVKKSCIGEISRRLVLFSPAFDLTLTHFMLQSVAVATLTLMVKSFDKNC